MYGHPVAAFQQNLNLWQEIIHPADLDLVLEAYQQLHTTGSKQIEYRIIRPDGAIRWLLQRSILVSDAGHPRRFDGMVTDITTYKQEQALYAERARLDAMRADIGAFLLQSNALPVILQQCAEAVVTYLDAAFVRIWTFEPESQLLVLQASAGLYTHVDGSHSRIPLGQFVIGQIAQQRLPHITEDLLTLPSISDRSWAHREGIVAFAGYPLIVEGEVVGVIAAFARQPFSPAGLESLAFVAGGLAQLIERKQTELVLQNFFRLSLDLLCIADSNGYFRDVNPAFEQTLGISKAEVLAKPMMAFIHPNDVATTYEQLTRLRNGQEVIDFENRYQDKGGSYRWLSWRAAAATDTGLIYAVARDVTGQKRQQQLMEQTQAAAQVGGWELDLVTEDLYWTEETYRIHDTTPATYQPVVETAIAFFVPEAAVLIRGAVQQARQNGQPWDLEVELITAQQRRIWVHVIGKVQVEDGKAIKVFGSIQDVTARRQTEMALRQSEAHIRVILDSLPDPVFVSDKEGVLLDSHSSAHQLHYLPPEEFLGKQVTEVIPGLVGQQMQQAIVAAAKGTRHLIEYPLLIQGEVRHFEARLAPLDTHQVLTIVRDVTEQKQAEEERFIRKIAEAVPHTMYVYDLDEERYVYINHQARQNFGYAPEEIMQMGSAFFANHLHNDDLARFPELVARWDSASDGQIFETEYQLRHPNGEWHWFAGRDTVFFRKPDGHVRQIIGTAHDITDYKRAQQQILTALKEKEALLKEVHHRVKNNLQIISSLLNLQAAQIRDSAVLQIFIETKNRVRSMALLHETLYSTENLARIDFARYVGSLCAHLFRSYGVDTQRISLQTAIASVSLDLDQAIPCGLIINELVSNAVKYAFPDHRAGTIWVALQPQTNQQYQLCVRDNGVGLPVDLDLTRTNSLGLRLVHDLTLQLNGRLTITRTEGATFTIFFEQ